MQELACEWCIDKSPPVPRLWRARVQGWREFDGTKVPSDAVAEWLLDDGIYAYWRGAPVAVRYDFAPR
jgi:hypothetical protein